VTVPHEWFRVEMVSLEGRPYRQRARPYCAAGHREVPGHEHLLCRSPVTIEACGRTVFVVTTPAFDDERRVPQRLEDLAISRFVRAPGHKLSITRSPHGLPRGDEAVVGADGTEPLLPNALGNELPCHYGTTMPGTPRLIQVGEHMITSVRLTGAGRNEPTFRG